MNKKGFIFTMDAVLTLLPIFVVLASVSGIGGIDTIGSYRMLSSERYAQDVLTVLERNDTLLNMSWIYQTGVARGDNILITYSQDLLNLSLNSTIPTYLGYNATVITPRGTFSVASSGELSEDIISVWRTSVGPEKGWAGAAWYMITESNFTVVNRTTTSTIWNFHNYLTNYYDRSIFCSTGWGGPSGVTNISISTPPNATLLNAFYYLGARISNNPGIPFNASFFLNGGLANSTGTVDSTGFPDYTLVNTFSGRDFFNSRMDVPVGDSPAPGVLGPGNNNMHLLPTASCGGSPDYDNLPWFALIANYTNPVPTPQNVQIATFSLPNAEGATDGTITVTWADDDTTWAANIAGNDNGLPYLIPETSGGTWPSTRDGSAISVVRNFIIPGGVTVLDAQLDINLVASVDGARVEANDTSSGQWVTIFNSFDINGIDYTDVEPANGEVRNGYGNLPGKINVNPSFITPGSGANAVRVTAWDYAPGTDRDFVGILDSTIMISYASIAPISPDWDNFAYTSHQSSSFDYSQDRAFDINYGGQEALLFVGVGSDTRRVVVSVGNTSTFVTLYNSTVVPYMINLGELDAGLPVAQRILTTTTSTPSNYNLKEGSYTARVRVLAAQDAAENNAWESGDRDGPDPLNTQESNAELFSGTKVSVLYPEFVELLTVETYNATATEAEDGARKMLSEQLLTYGLSVPWNSSEIISQAMWVSGVPSATYVDLKIWYEG